MRNKTIGLLASAVVVAAGFAAAPSGALARRNSAARSCARIAADAERLACYDRLFRAARPSHAQRKHGEPSPESSAGSRAASSAGAEPSAPPKSASAPAARREALAARKTQAHAKAAKAADGHSGGREVTVVRIRRIRQTAEAFFVTDDGHVWRQTDQRQTVFPKPPFRAVISGGFLGSHFLSPVGGRVSVHVTEEPQ